MYKKHLIKVKTFCKPKTFFVGISKKHPNTLKMRIFKLYLPLGAYCVETSQNSLFVCLCVCLCVCLSVCLSVCRPGQFRPYLTVFLGYWDIGLLN